MVAKSENITTYLRGTAHYAKLLGDPRPNFTGDNREWTVELELTPAGVEQLVDLKLSDRIKRKEDFLNNAPYITLRQRETRRDGKTNSAPRVVDIKGNPWDENILIGNGSKVDVRLNIVPPAKGKPKAGIYLNSVRILDLVPYVKAEEFPEIDESDPFFGNVASQEDELNRLIAANKSKPTAADLDDDLDDLID